MSFLLGLTGSIGMGKSTVAAMFQEQGVPVWDADKTVARLYGRGGGAVARVGAEFPKALVDGEIDRPRLREQLSTSQDFARLNAIVHPLVAEDREIWARNTPGDILVFDIPLLFENRLETAFDAVAVVHVNRSTQEERVLRRSGMTQQTFAKIAGEQWPSAHKVAHADYVIPTQTREEARKKVLEILRHIRENHFHA